MRFTAVVAIACFMVVLALAGCLQITTAPSPAAVAPPTVASAAPPGAAVEPPPVAAAPVALAPPAVASRPPAVAPTPAPAPARSPAPKSVSKAPAPAQIVAPAPPTLDLASLEARLRATSAIGVFTKLSLKNQVSDLLDQFKTFHHGGVPALTTLREEYDLLLLKVLSLLQDNDASLASAVSASRESIWGILVDPAKFAKLG
jgi:hypothetical protein